MRLTRIIGERVVRDAMARSAIADERAEIERASAALARWLDLNAPKNAAMMGWGNLNPWVLRGPDVVTAFDPVFPGLGECLDGNHELQVLLMRDVAVRKVRVADDWDDYEFLPCWEVIVELRRRGQERAELGNIWKADPRTILDAIEKLSMEAVTESSESCRSVDEMLSALGSRTHDGHWSVHDLAVVHHFWDWLFRHGTWWATVSNHPSPGYKLEFCRGNSALGGWRLTLSRPSRRWTVLEDDLVCSAWMEDREMEALLGDLP